MNDLPPGFLLDEAPAPARPAAAPVTAATPDHGLPEGFVLDAPEPRRPKEIEVGALPNSHGGTFVSGLINGAADLLTRGGKMISGEIPVFGADGRVSDGAVELGLDAALMANPAVPAKVTTQGLQGVARSAQESWLPNARAKSAAEAPATAVRQAAENIGVELPRVASTDSMALQRFGQAVKSVPLAGDPLVKRSEAAIRQIGDAVERTAGEFGGSTGYNAGYRVGQVLGDAAEVETTAARKAAQTADEAATRRWEQNRTDALGRIDADERAAFEKAEAATGNRTPDEMGTTVTERVRAAEQAARTKKEQLYGIAGQADASIEAGSVREVRGRVAQALEDDGWRIDPTLTPATSRMMDELARLSNLQLPNKAVGRRPAMLPGEEAVIAGVSLAGIESSRKALGNMSRAATNDADRAAAKIVMRQFDGWLDDAFDTALYSGSDDALKAIRAARAANADWRTRFGFNPAADADRLLNRIATGEVTPQETANWIIGANRVGSAGSSARLIDRIRTATGGDAGTLDAIRGSVWNRLTQSADGVDAKKAAQIANDIREFLGGSGKEVATKLFDRDQQAVMIAYSDAIRTAQMGRKAVDDLAKATQPSPTKVEIGPMQELANTVLGRQGRADEAIYKAIQSYSQAGGGGGNIAILSRLVSILPQEVRGDLAGSMIRNMGVSPRSREFSADVWLSNWNKTTPEAKAVLFGNAGSTRAALDDIAAVAERMKDLQKFGNPSGTTQTMTGAGLLTWGMADPLTAMGTVFGARAAAEALSRPASAAAASRWSRAYERLFKEPGEKASATFDAASKFLAAIMERELAAPVIREGAWEEVKRSRLSAPHDAAAK